MPGGCGAAVDKGGLRCAQAAEIAPVMSPVTSSGLDDAMALSATLRPRRMTTTRSQTSKTSGMRWLMRMTERPCSFIRRISASTSATWRTLMAAVGSSINTILDLASRVRAMATACRWPPDMRITRSAGRVSDFNSLKIFFDARRPGRFETYIGKGALEARYGFYGGAWDGLDRFIETLAHGDEAARLTAADWVHYAARGLSVLCCLLEPEKIVIGGSVSALFPHVGEALEAKLEASLIDGFPMPRITLAPETLGRPALGAACLLHQQMLSGEDHIDA